MGNNYAIFWKLFLGHKCRFPSLYKKKQNLALPSLLQFVNGQNGTLASSTDEDAALKVSKILAAEAISRSFERTQSMGGMLANFLADVADSFPFESFSYYSKEDCHEHVHGHGTCPKHLSRDDACTGTAIASNWTQELLIILR